MATRITEYGEYPRHGIVPAQFRSATQNALTTTGSSQQSSAFSASTVCVLVQSDEQVYVNASSANPTATANDYRLNAGCEQYFDVKPGWKVAIK